MKMIFIVEDRESDSTAKSSINELAKDETVSPDTIINSITDDIQSVVKNYGLESYCDDVIIEEQNVLRESLKEIYNMLTECLDDIVRNSVSESSPISDDKIERIKEDIYNRIKWYPINSRTKEGK